MSWVEAIHNNYNDYLASQARESMTPYGPLANSSPSEATNLRTWEINGNELKFHSEIGKGAYGIVCKGIYH